MKKIFILSAIAMALLANNAYSVEQNFEVKTIAVVDIKKIIDESLAAKTAKAEVDKLKNKYIAEIKANEKKLQDRQKELMEQKKALSQDAFNKKVVEFRQRINDERQSAMKKEKILESAFIKSLELIRDETMKVVAEIAKAKNIDIVVPTSQLLFAKSGIDISSEVLTKLNKRLSKVDITLRSNL
jgi:Skp family chaperone for outer membrane proteins